MDGSSVWRAPQKPFVKWNCDGSWDEASRAAGISGICRDEEGTLVGIMADYTSGSASILETECLAILNSMHRALKQGFSHCIFETDCTDAFASITLRRHGPNNSTGLVREILNILLTKKNWRLSLLRREANCLADNLARLAREKAWRWSNAEALPRLPGLLP